MNAGAQVTVVSTVRSCGFVTFAYAFQRVCFLGRKHVHRCRILLFLRVHSDIFHRQNEALNIIDASS